MFSIFKSKKSRQEVASNTASNTASNDSTNESVEVNNNTDKKEEKPEKKEEKGSVGSLLKSILSSVRIGSDVLSSGISLPAWIYEPLSILQRQTEMLEYTDLLDKAARCKDRRNRMAYVVAFAVSGYSGTQRYHNAFNPIIGETYEYVDEERGYNYIAEQVSHHPPISAVHAESKNWVFYQNSSPKTSFLGNALELDTSGRTHIYFPKTKDHYYYTNPKTRIHNLLLGKMWMEHHGHLNVSNLKNGDSCSIKFKKCSFFGNTCIKKIEGAIKDKDDNIVLQFNGEWDQYVEATWHQDTKDFEKDTTETLWRLSDDNFINDKYNLTIFAANLSNMDERLEKILPPTDSRLRMDRKKVEQGEFDSATKLKKLMEERQRSDKKSRSAEGDEWIPQWFHKIPDEDGGHTWVYCGDYWDQREKKINNIQEDLDTDELLNGGNAKGTAADFRSYEL
jgi:flagellum-specific peptidoglycan hydrolase FlgJ